MTTIVNMEMIKMKDEEVHPVINGHSPLRSASSDSPSSPSVSPSSPTSSPSAYISDNEPSSDTHDEFTHPPLSNGHHKNLVDPISIHIDMNIPLSAEKENEKDKLSDNPNSTLMNDDIQHQDTRGPSKSLLDSSSADVDTNINTNATSTFTATNGHNVPNLPLLSLTSTPSPSSSPLSSPHHLYHYPRPLSPSTLPSSLFTLLSSSYVRLLTFFVLVVLLFLPIVSVLLLITPSDPFTFSPEFLLFLLLFTFSLLGWHIVSYHFLLSRRDVNSISMMIAHREDRWSYFAVVFLQWVTMCCSGVIAMKSSRMRMYERDGDGMNEYYPIIPPIPITIFSCLSPLLLSSILLFPLKTLFPHHDVHSWTPSTHQIIHYTVVIFGLLLGWICTLWHVWRLWEKGSKTAMGWVLTMVAISVVCMVKFLGSVGRDEGENSGYNTERSNEKEQKPEKALRIGISVSSRKWKRFSSSHLSILVVEWFGLYFYLISLLVGCLAD